MKSHAIMNITLRILPDDSDLNDNSNMNDCDENIIENINIYFILIIILFYVIGSLSC